MTQCISDYDDLVQGMAKGCKLAPKTRGRKKEIAFVCKKVSISQRKHGE